MGDVGDEYNYSPPMSDVRVTSAHARDVRVRRVEEGHLCAALLIEFVLPVPAAAAADRASRSTETVDVDVVLEVRIRAGSPVVEGVVRVDNRARDHRLRVLFDTGTPVVGAHRADTAFGIAGFGHAELPQVAETAVQMRRDLEELGARARKTHRVYARDV